MSPNLSLGSVPAGAVHSPAQGGIYSSNSSHNLPTTAAEWNDEVFFSIKSDCLFSMSEEITGLDTPRGTPPLWELSLLYEFLTSAQLEQIQRRPPRRSEGWSSAGRKGWEKGNVQPGEKKLWGDLIVAFQDLKEPTGEMERDCGEGPGVPGQEGRVRRDIWKEFYPVRVTRPWCRLYL